ncbi:MAG: TIGR03619 family F420-dependent LLM class oxidoreductase [Candidatus Binatia bacterium]|nr:TIGR03619 family F420-dependent LLM class oxidoreductase [Candidatus Binatia bacterium]
MKFGVVIRNMGPQSTRETIAACARAAEAAGFDAAFVVDHLAIPPDQTEGSGGRYLDPLTTLAYLAGITQKIRLGVSVLVLPYRPAVLMAKQVATLQELSGERLILGAGVGWLRQEFEALGVDPRKRGALTDETLAVFHTLFANDVSSYEGKLIRFPAFVFAPRPARPPIWIGGSGPKALERTLRFGDAYYPIGLQPPEIAQIRTYFQEEAEKRSRPVPELVVGGMIREGDPAAMIDRIAAYREAGASFYVLGLGRYADADVFRRGVERFATQVMPRL